MIKVYSYYFEELLFKFSLRNDAGDGCPQWLEDEAFPPLSPRDAIAASKAVALEILSAYPWADPTLASCALKRTSHLDSGWWYYDIDWWVWSPDNDGSDRSGLNIPVMLNGKVPPFEIFKYADRASAWKT